MQTKELFLNFIFISCILQNKLKSVKVLGDQHMYVHMYVVSAVRPIVTMDNNYIASVDIITILRYISYIEGNKIFFVVPEVPLIYYLGR